MSGWTHGHGVGDAVNGLVLALGDGVNQTASETTVAVGGHTGIAKDVLVTVHSHPALAVDWRFKTSGNGGVTTHDVTVDTVATPALRWPVWTHTADTTSTAAFEAGVFWARYTASTTVTGTRAASGPAFAAWAGLACDGRCTTTSTTFSCSVSGAGGASKVIMVENYDAATEYEVWGDYNGDTFCCESNNQYDPAAFLITGSAYADTLTFIDSLSASQLQRTSATAITAVINGGAGADTIFGSDYALNYAETLNGEAGDDLIWAGADVDICDGGADEDTIVGGGGADTLYGGTGNDTISGSDGDDIIFGDGGADAISGGNGDDIIDGGPGGDTICGDAEVAGDILDDGDAVQEATPDQLWGANLPDYLYCDAGTSVDSSSTLDAACDATFPPRLTSKPTACP